MNQHEVDDVDDVDDALAGIVNHAGIASRLLNAEMDRCGLSKDEAFINVLDELDEVVAAARRAFTPAPSPQRALPSDLTVRERQILVLTASGLVNKQIADLLDLSHNTVRNHGQNILYKLDAHSRLEAVATAVRQGIISYPASA